MTLPDIYSKAIEASIEASNAVLEIYNTSFHTETKGDGSPVTAADLVSSEIIQTKLKTTFIPLINEEFPIEEFNNRAHWSTFWCVDPLDGTKEFIQKNGEFCINIALIENCTPVFGVIAIPAQSKLFFGGPKLGAFSASFHENYTLTEITPVQLKEDNNKIITVVASRNHRSEITELFLSNLEKNVKESQTIFRGSAIKFIDLATGFADVYIRDTPMMEWDVAAGHAILQGVGGVVVDLKNRSQLLYNKKSLMVPGIIATTKLSLLQWQFEGI